MILSRQILPFIPASSGIDIPAESLFSLPEKVMQFGTGVLLRGLPDYFIDKANKKGIFNGRIVLVKSTALGDSYSFQRQDNLYTQLVRGIAAGRQSDETIVNASISRLLTAAEDWKEILNCAATPGIQIIFSNTTEVGIVFDENDVRHLALLDLNSGLIAVPCRRRATVFSELVLEYPADGVPR